MTVATTGKEPGRLLTIIQEMKGEQEAEGRPVNFSIEKGKVYADLRIGADVAGVKGMVANSGISSNGMMLAGQGFVVSRPVLHSLGFGQREGMDS
jgi:hypothetical protein